VIVATGHSTVYSDGVVKIQLKFSKLQYFLKNCKFFDPYIGILALLVPTLAIIFGL